MGLGESKSEADEHQVFQEQQRRQELELERQREEIQRHRKTRADQREQEMERAEAEDQRHEDLLMETIRLEKERKNVEREQEKTRNVQKSAAGEDLRHENMMTEAMKKKTADISEKAHKEEREQYETCLERIRCFATVEEKKIIQSFERDAESQEPHLSAMTERYMAQKMLVPIAVARERRETIFAEAVDELRKKESELARAIREITKLEVNKMTNFPLLKKIIVNRYEVSHHRALEKLEVFKECIFRVLKESKNNNPAVASINDTVRGIQHHVIRLDGLFHCLNSLFIVCTDDLMEDRLKDEITTITQDINREYKEIFNLVNSLPSVPRGNFVTAQVLENVKSIEMSKTFEEKVEGFQ